MLDLKELRRVASEATQGDYGSWFETGYGSVDVVLDDADGSTEGVLIAKVPADRNRKHIAAFNPKTALALLDLLDKSIKVAEYYSDSVIVYNRSGCHGTEELEDNGTTAREFLAVIKKEVLR
jgi:hypothetical protein